MGRNEWRLPTILKGFFASLLEDESEESHDSQTDRLAILIRHMVETMEEKLWKRTLEVMLEPPDAFSQISMLEAILGVASEGSFKAHRLLDFIPSLEIKKEHIIEEALNLNSSIFEKVLENLSAA